MVTEEVSIIDSINKGGGSEEKGDERSRGGGGVGLPCSIGG
jgi:hypothetical protein